MRNLKSFAFAAVTCVLLASAAQAQTATGQMQWIGVNGSWATISNGTTTENVYTSPYRAQFKIPTNPSPALLPPAGTSAFGPTVDIFCVDFNHYANTGTSNVWFSNLAQANANNWFGTYTRPHTLQQYVEAAYLSQKILDGGNKALYSAAIWQIMSGGTFTYNGNSAQSAVDDAVYAFTHGTTGINLSDWVIVSEYKTLNGQRVLGDHQEFITQVTPEPATLLLLGTGLVVMLMAAGAFRRPTA